jgi:CDP-diacylglycerol--glycerol-3-phosphate 3-phosphatidyltransferase
MIRRFLSLPNFLSLSRILLTPLVALALADPGPRGTIICVSLFVVAAITDWLDGFTARRLNTVTPLGIALDPIADKVFAGVIVLLLIPYRDLPVAIAVLILGRDLVILAAGAVLLRGRSITLPSNLTGKYTFAAIAVLLASYVVRFEFGIAVFTWLTIAFTFLSLVNYARTFVAVSAGRPVPIFQDRPLLHYLRIGATLALSAVYLYRFWFDVLT